jgi:hypothetical protein
MPLLGVKPFSFFFCSWFSETGPIRYVTWAGLAYRFSCFSLPSAEIIGMIHHAWLFFISLY